MLLILLLATTSGLVDPVSFKDQAFCNYQLEMLAEKEAIIAEIAPIKFPIKVYFEEI